MKLAISADHGGFILKSEVQPWLVSLGHEVLDLGAEKCVMTDDYPDFAEAVAEAVVSGKAQRGILICGSGVGACIVANKFPGARACLCHDTYSARQGVEHDDMNILCLGGRVVGEELAKELIMVFLNAQFSGEERHQRRLGKVKAIEDRVFKTF